MNTTKAQFFSELLKTLPDPLPNGISEHKEFAIAKTVDDQHLVFGWANIAFKADGEQVCDLQSDLIDTEDLEKAAYLYATNYRAGGEMHIQDMAHKNIGTMIESCVFTKEKQLAMGLPEGVVPEGWWIGFKIHSDEAWDKIKDGTYKMFSIEGTGVREEVGEQNE